MACNIDARGKRLRLLSGLATTAVGLVFFILLLIGVLTAWWVWIIVIAALLGGAFQIYEGWAGWCAVRAMGFKTPV